MRQFGRKDCEDKTVLEEKKFKEKILKLKVIWK